MPRRKSTPVEDDEDPPEVPRLFIGRDPKPLRNPEKHLAAIDAWAASFAGEFPPPPEYRSTVDFRLPADRRLVDPPTTTPALQARCSQALLNAAKHLLHARPKRLRHQKIAVMISLPEMFMSRVMVFTDPEYYRTFEDRTHEWQRWTRLPRRRSLLREFSLRAPKGFGERGYHGRDLHPDSDEHPVYEYEAWMIGERRPRKE